MVTTFLASLATSAVFHGIAKKKRLCRTQKPASLLYCFEIFIIISFRGDMRMLSDSKCLSWEKQNIDGERGWI